MYGLVIKTMGFSAVLAGTVVLGIMFLVIGVFIGILLETSVNSLFIIKATALKNRDLVDTELEIVDIKYVDESSCFYISILNKGNKALFDLKTLDLMLIYETNSGSKINELLRYNESWFPVSVNIGNITSFYVEGRPIYPGETLVIRTKSLDSPSTSHPIKVVLATGNGFISEKKLIVVIE